MSLSRLQCPNVRVLDGAARPSLGHIGDGQRAVRVRPGDRPTWVDASPWKPSWEQWRRGADGFGIPLDVWLAVKLEAAVARTELAALGIDFHLLFRPLAPAAGSPFAAVDDSLRRWTNQLSGAQPPAEDELPEVVLPERLLLHPAVGTDWPQLLNQVDAETAISAECSAARAGMTLVAYALRTALADSTLDRQRCLSRQPVGHEQPLLHALD